MQRGRCVCVCVCVCVSCMIYIFGKWLSLQNILNRLALHTYIGGFTANYPVQLNGDVWKDYN